MASSIASMDSTSRWWSVVEDEEVGLADVQQASDPGALPAGEHRRCSAALVAGESETAEVVLNSRRGSRGRRSAMQS